ncbi:MAG: leucine-rich repeat domain-containing protein [Candidatus Latescibacterota bacterium]|jgi:dipeptidyl aminopeptidase/acylaminoacyl peptidase
MVLAWLVLGGCSGDSPAGPGSSETPADSAQVAVVFADSSLEAVVRQTLDTPAGTLDQARLDSLTQLAARGRGIGSLKGIDSLGNLQVLDLADNQVRDLSPLAGLKKLRFLDLSNNQITDLSSLAGLSDLEYLVLSFNQIADLSPLLGLMHLKSVDLSYNPLDDAALAEQLPRLQTGETQVVYVPIPGAETPADTLESISPWAIAFLSNRDGNDEIYAMQVDGSRPIKLTNTPGNVSQFAFSPDGTQFVYTSDQGDEQERYYLVYLQQFITGRAGILFSSYSRSATNRYSADPWWLPDGARVAVTPFITLRPAFPVYLVDTRDGSVDTLHWEGIYYPSWSPDGRRIAYLHTDDSLVSQTKEPVWDLWVQDVGGGNARLLNQNVYMFYDRPAWSPDSQQVAFSVYKGGSIEIYAIDADGGDLRRLTRLQGVAKASSWSPDGKYIAFEWASTWQLPEIFVMDADGNNPTNLTRSRSSDRSPIWFRKQWEW